MAGANDIGVSVVQPGEGDYVALPGFGAVFKLSSKNNGGEVSIVEHPFEVGLITAAHRHTREDEHSIVLAGEIGFRSDDSEVVLGPGGYITLRHNGNLHHIGIGRIHYRTRVLILAQDHNIRIINAATGELLRDFTLDPTRNYQPTGAPKGPTRKNPEPNVGSGLFRCLATPHW